MIVRDALHGQRVLDEYVRYYHGSNQKVLATAAALLRLGSTWRFRTELSGPPPDGDGTIVGDLVLRGSGDPSLRDAHLDAMAEDLARRGAVRVEGRVLGDPRRIGSDEAFVAGRSPVRVGWSAIEVHVRPADKVGASALASLSPGFDGLRLVNQAVTVKGRVGDQSDVVVFSIMVEGLRHRAVTSVRSAQVSAANAMMRYARGTLGPAPAEEAMPTQDLETGGESAELEGEADLPESAPTEKSGKDMDQMLKDFGGPGNEP
jgi:hypothetical protein